MKDLMVLHSKNINKTLSNIENQPNLLKIVVICSVQI